ncbi:sodium:proton antiporter [Oleiagrimonas sp. C23AA]|uniref:cation:proton antiporter n=1 Tax=Oleiagrimonas sp. C23AA TaxID=2719047 RepID=UPI00141FD51A|nr:sodium:proton antiporter [Oleiagrimonas sp. C23AA]NII10894.1 sodium:proton antiporter [Oleiagrimonas sp. C23AA]
MLAVGFVAQWLAWRVKLPAILFLLLAGLVMGPLTGWIHPDRIFGPTLFPMVSLAVALILFEGSMTLRLGELRGIGRAVRGLVSYGAVAAMLLLAAAVHWIAGLEWELALLFGALTCVTGPTVITPMLRTLRPNAKIANALRWEGIVIDPLGALFAVLVFEAILSREQGHSLGVFALTVLCGIAIGCVGAWLLAFVLRRHLIPEYLQNFGAMAVVLGAFTSSNALTHESGLLAVTIMGIVIGNLRGVHIDDIMDFKENLSTLLVSVLFIVLAARLSWPLPDGTLLTGIWVFLAAQFVARPLSVLVATVGSALSWRERALVAYVSPRGIVAAAVSALFAIKLESLHVNGAEQLVPLVFILIIGTVLLQSGTARPLARWLKVAEPEPHGVLVYGSDPVARTVARALADADFRVLVADDDWDGIRAARMAGLNTFFGNPTSQHADHHLDLTGLGRLLAMSTRREMNSLACVHYRQEFGRDQVFRLRNLHPEEQNGRQAFSGNLVGHALFGEDMTHARFAGLLTDGWRLKSTRLTDTFDWPQFIEQYGSGAVLLFAVDGGGSLRIAAGRRLPDPKPGWLVIALVPPDGTQAA